MKHENKKIRLRFFILHFLSIRFHCIKTEIIPIRLVCANELEVYKIKKGNIGDFENKIVHFI